jgi:hypothetical protein
MEKGRFLQVLQLFDGDPSVLGSSGSSAIVRNRF